MDNVTPDHSSVSPRGFRARGRAGFALVVTLSLMILLTVMAVGLLTLSAVSLRASSGSLLVQEARQNARLALGLAISELQKSTGPDQRVTAVGAVREATAAQPHLTGVWRGWKWDGAGGAPNFSERKQADFLRWLVSTPRDEDTADFQFVNTRPGGERATLVRGNAGSDDLVEAQVVPVRSSGAARNGGFAWAVFDESTKLPLALPGTANDSPLAAMRGMAAAPLPGYAVSSERSWSGLADLGMDRLKLLTPGGSALVGVRPADRGFHDLAAPAAGLATNVAEGGLALDLSRLFDGDSPAIRVRGAFSLFRDQRAHGRGPGAFQRREPDAESGPPMAARSFPLPEVS